MVNLAKLLDEEFKELSVQVSKYTIKRLLKTAGFRWRRVRKSLASQRDTFMYAYFKEELQLLQKEQEQGHVHLVFYDEAGFSLNPNSVYAWLAKDSPLVLPASRGNVMTVAGFLQTDNTLMAYTHQGSTTSELFIAYVDNFLANTPCHIKTVLILDNASFHKSALVKSKIPFWKTQNLYLQFLPPYCSELNKIEILWHHIKHLWLNIQDYNSKQNLENAVTFILENFNSKYSISFA